MNVMITRVGWGKFELGGKTCSLLTDILESEEKLQKVLFDLVYKKKGMCR